MSESQHVQVYEIESISKGVWNPDTAHPWVNINMEDCTSRDEYRLPSSEWSWVSNWKIDKEAGRTDKDGWEFASKYERFFIKDRKPKPEKLWNDKSRRRLWVRTMRREMSAGIGSPGTPNGNKVTDVIEKVRNGLATIHQARVKIEQTMLADPNAVSSEKRNHLIMAVRKNVDDISGMLEHAEEKSSAGKSGSNKATITMLGKLRRDCEKEKDAIEKALLMNNGDENQKQSSSDDERNHVFTKLSKGNKSTSLNFNYNTGNTNSAGASNISSLQSNANSNVSNTRPTLMSGLGVSRSMQVRGGGTHAGNAAPVGFNFGGLRSGTTGASSSAPSGNNQSGGTVAGGAVVMGGKGSSTFSLDQCANACTPDGDALEVKDGHYMSHALQQKMIEQVRGDRLAHINIGVYANCFYFIPSHL